MRFDKTCSIPSGIDRLWDFMIDASQVTLCMPGLEQFREIAHDRYEGMVKISLGPVTVRLSGTLSVLERDRTRWVSRMEAQANDLKIGGDVKATFTTRLVKVGEHETEMQIETEAKVLGRLGEFGQPMMKKTADRYLTQFIANVSKAIGTPST